MPIVQVSRRCLFGQVDSTVEQVLSNDSVLLMTSFSRDDAGLYVCKAYSDAGQDIQQLTIRVTCKHYMHVSMRVYSQIFLLFIYIVTFTHSKQNKKHSYRLWYTHIHKDDGITAFAYMMALMGGRVKLRNQWIIMERNLHLE